MAYDKVVDSALLDAAMAATAESIRSKGGTAEKIAWDSASGFAKAVEALPSGGSSEGNVQLTVESLVSGQTINAVFYTTLESGGIKASSDTPTNETKKTYSVLSGSFILVSISGNATVAEGMQTEGSEWMVVTFDNYNIWVGFKVTAEAGGTAYIGW